MIDAVSLQALLFVPGDSRRKIAKAVGAGIGCVILDLEDAVAPVAKAGARAAVREQLDGARTSRLCVRINAADSEWHLDDLVAIGAGRPDAIMLPKCTGPADVARLADQLAVIEVAYGIAIGTIAIIPLVTETAASLRQLDYRAVTARLCALGFAAEDLASDLGVAPRDRSGAMNPLVASARLLVAMAAREAGVPAIDTPFPDPGDAAGLTREAADAAALGYAGKMCIHPAQVPLVRHAFTPDPDQLRWARAVRAAFAAAPDAGVTTLDGRMIDKAHLRLAERRLAMTDADGGDA